MLGLLKRIFIGPPIEERREIYLKRGYKWAAEQLILHRKTPEQVEETIEHSSWADGDPVNQFDVGARQAIKDFINGTKYQDKAIRNISSGPDLQLLPRSAGSNSGH